MRVDGKCLQDQNPTSGLDDTNNACSPFNLTTSPTPTSPDSLMVYTRTCVNLHSQSVDAQGNPFDFVFNSTENHFVTPDNVIRRVHPSPSLHILPLLLSSFSVLSDLDLRRQLVYPQRWRCSSYVIRYGVHFSWW